MKKCFIRLVWDDFDGKIHRIKFNTQEEEKVKKVRAQFGKFWVRRGNEKNLWWNNVKFNLVLIIFCLLLFYCSCVWFLQILNDNYRRNGCRCV